MKITIIGSSGSGKSTLAKKISEYFNIPRIEIDRIWFKHGGHKYVNGCTPEQKQEILDKIMNDVRTVLDSSKSWVCDGTYHKIQPLIATQADTVVLIKRPLIKRITSHLKRVLKGEGRHPEITAFQDLLFTKTLIKRWRRQEDERLDVLAEQFQDKLVVLKCFTEIDEYFDSLTRKNSPL